MKTSVVIFSLLLCATPAASEIIEIPVPNLLGSYAGEGDSRTTTVVLPMQPTAINSVSLRIGGTALLGEVMCEQAGVMAPSDWPMDFSAHFDAGEGSWVAGPRVPHDASGSFTDTRAFFSIPSVGPTWAFLADGNAEVEFQGAAALLVGLCFEVVTYPSAVLDEAVLIIDADFPVPVATSTWGRIKALYR